MNMYLNHVHVRIQISPMCFVLYIQGYAILCYSVLLCAHPVAVELEADMYCVERRKVKALRY